MDFEDPGVKLGLVIIRLEYVIVWLHYCTPQESSHPSSVVTTVLDVLLIIMIENDSTNRG